MIRALIFFDIDGLDSEQTTNKNIAVTCSQIRRKNYCYQIRLFRTFSNLAAVHFTTRLKILGKKEKRTRYLRV